MATQSSPNSKSSLRHLGGSICYNDLTDEEKKNLQLIEAPMNK